MQTMQSTKREFRAPPGYGTLKTTHKVDEAGVEGTLFVHEYDGGNGGTVANLQLRASDGVLTLPFIWGVDNGRTSAHGSKLLMQTKPNRKRGESWESEEFLARRVDIYRGQHGLFAITPFGLLRLQEGKPVRVANARGGFNAEGFHAAVQKERAAAEARKAAAPAQPKADKPSPELIDAVVQAVKENEGQKGARWDDVLGAVQARTLPEGRGKPSNEQVEAALEAAMDGGRVYEPTLGVLKTA